MALNDFQLKNLASKSIEYEVSDGKGLSIRVLPTGTKSWIFRYMVEGKKRKMTFGHYPTVSLADVRVLQGDAMKLIERGLDPAAIKLEAKAERKASPTVADLLLEFWDIELKTKHSGADQKRLLTKDVLPAWGARKVQDITRRDAVLLIDTVRERAKVTANRVQSAMVRMFNFAAERGVIEYSPLTHMRKKKETPRERVLTNDEVKLLWDGLDVENTKIDIYRVTKLALQLALVTGQRIGAIVGMTESELKDTLWTRSIDRNRKAKEAITIPLSDMALDIIEQARTYSGRGEFIFRSPQKENVPLTSRCLSMAISRHWQEMGIEEKFTPHDLRRTFRTRLAEIGIDDVVAERLSGHKLQGMLAVYNRHDYATEKRQALDRWSRRLKQIVGIEEAQAANIIEFKRKVV
jgi:integrase